MSRKRGKGRERSQMKIKFNNWPQECVRCAEANIKNKL